MTHFRSLLDLNAAEIAEARTISGASVDATESGFRIFDGKFNHLFYGTNLTYQNGAVVGGTITGYTITLGTERVQEFTEITNLSGSMLQEFISGHDMNRFIEHVFSGDDVILHSIAADGLTIGYGGNDELWTSGREGVRGGDGNDTLFGQFGQMDGGGGHDTLKFSLYTASLNQFTITHEDGWLHLVQPFQGRYGPIPADLHVKNVERIEFADGTLALDTGGNAGQAYRLYQAAFNRTPDTKGLAFWVEKIDKGMSLHDASLNFLSSPEFASIYGASSSNGDFITRLYANILERNGEATGLSFWNAQLDHGSWSRANVLAYFSESPENTAKVAPAIYDGIWLG